MRESRYLREIRRLDPVADHSRIVYLDTCFEFPWDTTRSLELALFRTFAVPSVAAVLDSTGEFGRAAQKRYDDTDLILSTIVEAGYESEEGKRAIRQMNRIHGRFEISNDDFLYVLSSFVFEPIRWNAHFGWRPLIDTEKLATFEFWCEVGGRMAIKEIPESFDDFERFNVEYERRHFRRTEESERVGRATRDMFLAWFPALPNRFGAQAIYALMDDSLLEAFGFPRPPRAVRAVVEATLRARARAVALLPPRQDPRRRVRRRTRTYGRDWLLEELGPAGYDELVPTEPLQALLQQAFPDATELSVVDRTGGGDHFQVIVASQRFEGLSLVDQHRLVYDALAAPLADGSIHELRIKTKGLQ